MPAPAFEADKWRLLVQDRQSGKTRDLTEKFDRSVGSFTWRRLPGTNTQTILFAAENRGNSEIFTADAEAYLDVPQTPKEYPGVRVLPLHADDLIALVFLKNVEYFAKRNLANEPTHRQHGRT
jgi:hypothetical protein